MTLYKYVPIDGTPDGITRIKQMVEENKIYCPSYQKLNDPLEVLFRRDLPKTNEDSIPRLTKSMNFYNQIKNLGVISFSTDFTNILLWSHYASKHEGFCIEFNSENLPKAREVIYSTHLPELTIDKINENHDIFYTKGTDWMYEAEYRFVSLDKCNDFVIIKSGAVTAVYFGLKTPDEFRRKVANILEPIGISMKVMVRPTGTYTLGHKEITKKNIEDAFLRRQALEKVIKTNAQEQLDGTEKSELMEYLRDKTLPDK